MTEQHYIAVNRGMLAGQSVQTTSTDWRSFSSPVSALTPNWTADCRTALQWGMVAVVVVLRTLRSRCKEL